METDYIKLKRKRAGLLADDLKTPVFDWEAGEFAVDAQGAVLTATGAAAVEQIVVKATQTTRGAFLVYADPDDPELDHKYGNDAARTLVKDMPEAAKISELTRNVREALVYDPWVIDVTDIQITRTGRNSATGSCTVQHIFGTTTVEGAELNG